MKKYNALKKLHPDYITLDQFYKILRVAKRSARYLLENGIVPAIDTGRKTWRWKIHIDDVITYLRKRDKVGSMIPTGAVSSGRRYNKNYAAGQRSSFSQAVERGQEREVAEYFECIFADSPDVLTRDDIGEMIGLNKESVLRIIKNGHIKFIAARPKYLIPKVYFLEFVASRRFINMHSNSDRFISVLTGFKEWREANNKGELQEKFD